MKQTLNRLTVTDRSGAYKFPPPKGAPTTGADPIFLGENILTDPEFNLFFQLSGSIYWWDRIGPLGASTYTLPYQDVTCPSLMRLPNGVCADKTLAGWVMTTGPYTVNDAPEDQAWKVGTFPTETGAAALAYAAYWAKWNVGGGGFPGEIAAYCPFLSGPFSARIEPGMSITWSGNAQAGTTTGTPVIFPYVRFYRQNWSQLRTDGVGSNLTTSPANYTTTTAAPTGAYYMRGSFGFSGGTGNSTPVLIHSAKLKVVWP